MSDKPTFRMTKLGDNMYSLKVGRDVVGYIRKIGEAWEATDRGVYGVGPSPLIAFDRWVAKRKGLNTAIAKRDGKRTFSFEKPAPVRQHDKRNPRKYKHQDWKYEDELPRNLRDEMPEQVREPELNPETLIAMPMPVIEFGHTHHTIYGNTLTKRVP
jgi:hypothetical protein